MHIGPYHEYALREVKKKPKTQQQLLTDLQAKLLRCQQKLRTTNKALRKKAKLTENLQAEVVAAKKQSRIHLEDRIKWGEKRIHQEKQTLFWADVRRRGEMGYKSAEN